MGGVRIPIHPKLLTEIALDAIDYIEAQAGVGPRPRKATMGRKDYRPRPAGKGVLMSEGDSVSYPLNCPGTMLDALRPLRMLLDYSSASAKRRIFRYLFLEA